MITSLPDAAGHFDHFGGRYVPEALVAALDQLEAEFDRAPGRSGVRRRARRRCAATTPAARAPLTEVPALRRRHCGGARDRAEARGPQPHRLAQDQQRARAGPAHQADGQDPGDRRDRGRASTAWPPPPRRRCSGLECTVYMGRVDTERQALNVARMRLLGAEVVAVSPAAQTLKDAMNEAMRDWVRQRRPPPTTSSARSPGRTRSRGWCASSSGSSATEARAQMLGRYGRLPDAVAACVGGGSNAIGHLRRLHRRPRGRAVRLRGRRRRGGDRHDTPRAIIGGSVGRAPRHARPTSCRTTTVRPGSRTRSRPGWTTPASGRSTPGCAATGRGHVRGRHRRRGDGGAGRC